MKGQQVAVGRVVALLRLQKVPGSNSISDTGRPQTNRLFPQFFPINVGTTVINLNDECLPSPLHRVCGWTPEWDTLILQMGRPTMATDGGQIPLRSRDSMGTTAVLFQFTGR